ncbi:MAG: DUF4465 domain-containing protein [Saprospiraceae bacterium]|nr:DUF4465 domain-containing protein [Saprospiraceae bacterium]
MIRYIFFLLIVSQSFVSAQTVADFESFDLERDTFLNGSEGQDFYRSGNVALKVDFDDEFNLWSGFSISTMTDTMTPGFTNQYSCISGSGVNESKTYSTAFIFDNAILLTEGEAAGKPVLGCYINNATYPYLSMRDGDQFAKKFGGPTGDDPDFFRIKIQKYYNGRLHDDSVVVYLADFRFDNNEEDFILDEWRFVDLKSLGPVDSLSFTLASSDVGAFGINTPTYFCIDNIITSDMTSPVDQTMADHLSVGPNPFIDHLRIEGLRVETNYRLYDLQGRMVSYGTISPENDLIFPHKLNNGIFRLSLENEYGKFFYSILRMAN